MTYVISAGTGTLRLAFQPFVQKNIISEFKDIGTTNTLDIRTFDVETNVGRAMEDYSLAQTSALRTISNGDSICAVVEANPSNVSGIWTVRIVVTGFQTGTFNNHVSFNYE